MMKLCTFTPSYRRASNCNATLLARKVDRITIDFHQSKALSPQADRHPLDVVPVSLLAHILARLADRITTTESCQSDCSCATKPLPRRRAP